MAQLPLPTLIHSQSAGQSEVASWADRISETDGYGSWKSAYLA